MKTATFLDNLHRLGVEIEARGDLLRCNAPRGVLTSDIRAELAQRKPEILALLRRNDGALSNGARRIERAPREHPLPLSFAQQRLWFLDQMEPGNPFYNLPEAVRLNANLNVYALEQTLQEISRRHEVLRTRFSFIAGEASQVISPPQPMSLPVIDLSLMPDHGSEVAVERLAREEARRPFDLARGPVFRARLLRLNERAHVLLLTIHHIVSDGWSVGILLYETINLYKEFSRGNQSALKELQIQYADYAYWQRRRLQEEKLESQLAYWKKQLEGANPTIELPSDKPRPALQSYHGARESIDISQSLSQSLKDLSRRQGVTLFVTILAAFQTLLYRYSGQTDISIGTPVASRDQIETERLIGVMVNILVMRQDMSANPTFTELLARTREMTLAAYSNKDLPFERLVEELQPQRDLSRSPLFQVMLIFQNAPIPDKDPEGLHLIPLNLHGGSALFDLTLTIVETEQGMSAAMEYNRDIFEAATISEMLKHFRTLMESAVTTPEQSVSALTLFDAAQHRRMLIEWNDTSAELDRNTFAISLFEKWAERSPDSIAVMFEDQQLTYGALNARSNQLAHFLKEFEIGPESIVGIFVRRSLDMVVAIFGILKSGAAYLPIDPAYPTERIRYVIDDSAVSVLIVDQQLMEQLPETRARIISLDREAESLNSISVVNPTKRYDAENLAYVIYTSGSTGWPKGVQVRRGALTNFLNSMRIRPGIESSDTVLSVTTLSFDIAALEIFLPLISGGRLVIASRETASDGRLLAELIDRERVSIIQATPATWRLLIEAEWSADIPVKALCGGEALPDTLANRLIDRCDSLWNLYGPTETTIWSTLSKVEHVTGPVSIGNPIANTQVFLLDRNLNPVALRASGELHIGGDGVARGYACRPDLTAERFIPDAFSGNAGARLYKTGDLARHLHNGGLEFLGRMDHQAKVRGMRIELEEIESVLSRHPQVRQAVAVLRDDHRGDKRIVSYIVSDEELRSDHLRAFLRTQIPEYMIPSAFIRMEALPLTPNGKINRKALPEPEQSRSAIQAARTLPSGIVEELLAGVWSQILKIEGVAAEENFFEAGGHSLLAMQVLSRVRDLFGVDLPVRSFFEAPTLAGLAASIKLAQERQAGTSEPLIKRMEEQKELPLSFAQQRLWFIDQLQPGNVAYNISSTVRLKGTLNLPAIEQSLTEVARRHEVLRTVFSFAGEQPLQEIQPPRPVRIKSVDLRWLDEQRREEMEERLAVAESQRPFDLARGPLLRALLLRLRDDEYLAIFTLQHIISDGWSMGVLVGEIGRLYEAFSRGNISPLPELRIQYADYALWQRNTESKTFDSHLSYWKETLKGAPDVIKLPADRPRPARQSFRGATDSFEISADLTLALDDISRREDVTLFMTTLSAFATLLHHYTREDDIVIGTNVANRTKTEIEGLIGFFVNNLVLRIDVGGDPNVRQMLQRVSRVCVNAYAHQDIPFEKIVDALRIGGDLTRNPLFQVLFVLHNNPSPGLILPALEVEPLHFDNRTSQFDISLNLFRTEKGLKGSVIYNTDIFYSTTISRMMGHYQSLLKEISLGVDRKIADLSMHAKEETGQLIHAFNAALE